MIGMTVASAFIERYDHMGLEFANRVDYFGDNFVHRGLYVGVRVVVVGGSRHSGIAVAIQNALLDAQHFSCVVVLLLPNRRECFGRGVGPFSDVADITSCGAGSEYLCAFGCVLN